MATTTTALLQGWHSRALQMPHPDPHSFAPSPESLILAVLLNAMAEPQGITVAFFAEPPTERIVAVDAHGRVSFVASVDFDGILSLAMRTLALPDTGAWGNSWAVKQPVTCQPNHRIFISPKAHIGTLSDMKQVSVYGFSKATKQLASPVNGHDELPHELWELTGLLLEARGGMERGESRDDLVLDRIKSVVKPLF